MRDRAKRTSGTMVGSRGGDVCSWGAGPRVIGAPVARLAVAVRPTALGFAREPSTAHSPGVVQMIRLAALTAAAFIALLCAAAPAAGYVYWSGSGAIGRANLDGTGVDNSFITVPPASDGVNAPCGLAVSATYVYWTDCNGGTATTLGRANIDGSAADNNFISGASNPCGVAVDSSYVYWDGDNPTQLGRANLDGTGVDQNFIPAGQSACGIAVNGSYIYFTDYRTNSIGRANLDGTGSDANFITDIAGAGGLAINGSYIYWGSTNSIGRANLDGSGVDNAFITGVSNPTGVAVDGSYIYWADYEGDAIGRANLDGSGVNDDFITTSAVLFSVAVDALGPQVGPVAPAGPSSAQVKAALSKVLKPSGKTATTKAILKARGYSFSFAAPSAGTLVIDWYATVKHKQVLVATASVVFHAAGKATAKVKLTGKGRKLLTAGKSVKISTKATFTPVGGTTTSSTKTTTLKR